MSTEPQTDGTMKSFVLFVYEMMLRSKLVIGSQSSMNNVNVQYLLEA